MSPGGAANGQMRPSPPAPEPRFCWVAAFRCCSCWAPGLGAVPLLRLAGAQSDYLSLALDYAFPALISLALSGPAIVLHGILTGVGDTRNVLAANVLGNGVNVVCNALLIYGLGPFPRLGVLGAGLGTASRGGVTLSYTLALFLRRGVRHRCGAQAAGCLSGAIFEHWGH